MSSVRFVGLDVHKDKVVMAVAEPGVREATVYCSTPNDVNKILKKLQTLSPDLKQLRVCYEAGPTGYGLYRKLKKAGVDCVVIAPSLVPHKAGLRIKTDRRDAMKLAHFLRSGDLTAVWVPDEQTEALRDLERSRDDAKHSERRARHQLSKFLLRNDRAYFDGREWTGKHMAWVRSQKFDDAIRQCVLDDYIKAVDDATERVKRLMQHIEKHVDGHAVQPLVKAMMSFRGIQLLSATVIAAEIGDLRRFKTARQFMAFLGLVPSETSSGNSVKRGSVTKTGNAHVRRILVEAVQHYRHSPRLSAALRKRQEGISQEVVNISWEAQQRLCRRMNYFRDKGKCRNKAIVALAREMAGFLWSVGQLENLLA